MTTAARTTTLGRRSLVAGALFGALLWCLPSGLAAGGAADMGAGARELLTASHEIAVALLVLGVAIHVFLNRRALLSVLAGRRSAGRTITTAVVVGAGLATLLTGLSLPEGGVLTHGPLAAHVASALIFITASLIHIGRRRSACLALVRRQAGRLRPAWSVLGLTLASVAVVVPMIAAAIDN